MADLYIRSKDGKRIEKMRHIAYEPIESFNYKTGKSTPTKEGEIFVNGRCMGEYTEEQAMGILDEIQKIIEPTFAISQCPVQFEYDGKLQPIAIEPNNMQPQIQQIDTFYQLPTFEEK